MLADAVATVTLTHAPVPESALADLPAGAHVLIMTHDHVEDLAITDQALRRDDLASIGLIGSRSKWARFRVKLSELGHADDRSRAGDDPHRHPRSRGQGACDRSRSASPPASCS